MKYYLDTEFIEGTQKKRFLGIPYGSTKNTIDLISIGIVCEDDREYYAVSKDFNLKEVWNRFQLDINKNFPMDPEYNKVYWIRENVLRPIFEEFLEKERGLIYKMQNMGVACSGEVKDKFTYRNFKKLLKKYGTTDLKISKEVKNFIACENINSGGQILLGNFHPNDKPKPEFYAYYADYDWVVFCWLFGRMIDLPNGFPMYCTDLKQILDEKVSKVHIDDGKGENLVHNRLSWIKTLPHYPDPKKYGEHNALGDAKWARDFHQFLEKL